MTGIALFALKLTIVLLLGALTAALLRTRSAAARHFVWTMTLAAALLLPVATNVAPVVRVAVPEVGVTQAAQPLTRPSATLSPQAGRGATMGESPSPRVRGEGAPERSEGADEGRVLAAIYLTGVGAMLLWLLFGQLGVARIARSASPADSDEWRALFAEARARIGVKRAVRVALSAKVGAPFTSGWLRPIILLPAGANEWPAERKLAALLHELAHVARNDAPVHLLAGLACALYWLHPAVWLALRRLRREGEQATDDRVIAKGMIAPEYAAQLVDVARAARSRGFAGLAAVAMACPSHLETRLRALLDETRIRGAVSRRVALAAVAVVALILVPLAGARPKVAGTYERTVDAKAGGTLVLDLETGADVNITGDNASRVEVRGTLAGPDAKHTRVETTNADPNVHVTTRFVHRNGSHSTSHNFDIRVPRQYNVKISSAGGGVSITDVEGSFEGSTGGGPIDLARVRGEARLSTGGGDITVVDSELDGRVSTGGGAVRFNRVSGGLRGSSGSGSESISNGIDITTAVNAAVQAIDAIPAFPAIPATVTVNAQKADESERAEPARVSQSGVIEIRKDGGAVDLQEAPHGAIISTGGGRVVVGQARGFVKASTGGGQIRIGPVAGSAKASTGAGSVIIDVEDAGGAAQTVEVSTGSGSVEVRLPANFDGRFDIETAYTESHRPVDIRSDFELQPEPVTDWDGRQGTPRRYVRAHGSTGSGAGLVRIRAVNGHVRIRRD